MIDCDAIRDKKILVVLDLVGYEFGLQSKDARACLGTAAKLTAPEGGTWETLALPNGTTKSRKVSSFCLEGLPNGEIV